MAIAAVTFLTEYKPYAAESSNTGPANLHTSTKLVAVTRNHNRTIIFHYHILMPGHQSHIFLCYIYRIKLHMQIATFSCYTDSKLRVTDSA